MILLTWFVSIENLFFLSKLWYRNNETYFRLVLLLSGDICLNPGPINGSQQYNNDQWAVFKKIGIHFAHININSLLVFRFINGSQQHNNDQWAVFKKIGIHFAHININSLLPKKDELRYIAKLSDAVVISISELKLDDSGLSSEIQIENYNLIRFDRNRYGGGVACFIRNELS